MKRIAQCSIKTCWVLLFCLLSGAFVIVQAEEVPEHIRKVIEARFPGAVIDGIERESWKGRKV